MTIELIKTSDRYRDFSDISRIRDVIPVTASSTSTEREIIFERKSLVGWLICNPASPPSSSRCYKFLTSTRSRHQNSHHVRLSRLFDTKYGSPYFQKSVCQSLINVKIAAHHQRVNGSEKISSAA